MEDAYLGDGVYASCDGDSIFLDLRGQDNTASPPPTCICLEPAVIQELEKYIAKLKALGKADIG